MTYEWGSFLPSTGNGYAEPSEEAAQLTVERRNKFGVGGWILVHRQVGPWEPVLSETEQAATDAYRETIEVALTKAEPPRTPVPDLMAALEASLAGARADREKIATALPDPGQVSPM